MDVPAASNVGQSGVVQRSWQAQSRNHLSTALTSFAERKTILSGYKSVRTVKTQSHKLAKYILKMYGIESTHA